MSPNPVRVIRILQRNFPDEGGDNDVETDEDYFMADTVEALLRSAAQDDGTVPQIEQLIFLDHEPNEPDVDADFSGDGESEEEGHQIDRFHDSRSSGWTFAKRKEVVEFWLNNGNKRRSINTVKHKYTRLDRYVN